MIQAAEALTFNFTNHIMHVTLLFSFRAIW